MENYNYWTASHWNSVQSNSFTCSKLIFKLWAYRVAGLTCGLLSCARTWQHVKIQYCCNYLAIKLGFTSHAKQLISSTISIQWVFLQYVLTIKLLDAVASKTVSFLPGVFWVDWHTKIMLCQPGAGTEHYLNDRYNIITVPIQDQKPMSKLSDYVLSVSAVCD